MKPISPIAAAIVADIAFRRKVERLHARGPRAVLEILAEIGAERSIRTIIDQTLDRHLAVSDQALEAVGGDRLPADPIHAVSDDDVPPSPKAA